MTATRIYEGAWDTHGVVSTLTDEVGDIRTYCGHRVPLGLTRVVSLPFFDVVLCRDCYTDDEHRWEER